MPLITVEKIGEGEPMPFRKDGKTPSEGIRACEMGHVIAGGAMGWDLALYGADVLNIWRPNATEGRGLRLGCVGWDALHHLG